MGTLGTFDAFTTSRLGIYAAMQGLQVTGNNISNINTTGYTRQRIDQVSLKTGGNDRYASIIDNHVGNGALVTGVNQIRDPYLDIRYRTTNADTGYANTILSGLQEIAAILDEVGRGGNSDETYGDGLLYAELQDLAEKLRSYSADPSYDNDSFVRGAAETLTSLFRTYADKLEKLRQDVEKDLNQSVTDVNSILTSIRDLNQSIREYEIHGDLALELRDERNRQIDALSEYMNIKVEYSMEDVGAGIQVEKLTIYLGDSNPDPNVETDSSMLVDGLYATQLSMPEEKPVINPDFGSTDPDKADLKDYMYLMPDGVTGTNNVDEADKVPNDNYTIQLGKLLDVDGKEWKTSTTTWGAVTSTPDGAAATYQYSVGYNPDPNDPTPTIRISGTDYTLDATVTDAASLATFIAGKLNSADYNISTDGSNIVFTAKNIGAIGSDGPAAPPELKLENGGTAISLGARQTVAAGVDADPNADAAGATIDPVTGNKTTIGYYAAEDGTMYRIQVVTQYTREVALDDNDLHGSLQAERELLTEEGEFASSADVLLDENAMTKRGIPYYQKSFDLLAQQFAMQYNQLNQGFKIDQNGNYLDEDNQVIPGLTLAGEPVNKYTGLSDAQAQELIDGGCYKMDENGDPILDADGNQIADLDRWLEAKGAVKMGGVLFSNSNDGDDTTGITAANINVSHSWSNGSVLLVPKFEVIFADDENSDGLDHTTQNTNANHMLSLIDKALDYDPADLFGADAEGPLLFTGSFNDMFSHMMSVQGTDARITTVDLNLYYTTLVSLDSSRQNISGVDLNDEAMNMMQYQKAYSAACRLMTVIDSVLDRLINNTGVTV